MPRNRTRAGQDGRQTSLFSLAAGLTLAVALQGCAVEDTDSEQDAPLPAEQGDIVDKESRACFREFRSCKCKSASGAKYDGTIEAWAPDLVVCCC